MPRFRRKTLTQTVAVATAATSALIGLTAVLPATAVAAGKTTTLVMWEADGPLFKVAIAPVVAKFEKAHPNVKVQVDTEVWSTFQQRVLSAAAGAALPCIMYTNSQVEGAIAQANVMTPIPTNIIPQSRLAEYLPGFIDGLKNANGVLDFVPNLGGADQFYIRTDTPNGDTIPHTYSQWIKWGERATKRNSAGQITTAGIGWFFQVNAIPGILTDQFASMVMAAGGQFLNNGDGVGATKAMFDSPAGLKVLQFIHDTIWKYHIAQAPDQQTFDDANPVSGIVTGREASKFLGPWFPNALADLAKGGKYTPAEEHVRDTWDAVNFAPMPDQGGKNVAIISTDGWGVPKSCPDQTLAWQFIKTMTSTQSYLTFFSVFQHPIASKVAFTSPRAAQLIEQNMPGAKHETLIWRNAAYISASVAEPHNASNADIYKVVENGIVAAMNKPNANLSGALKSMATQVDGVLARG